jgi:AcrR family transcriptional regulator
MDECSVTESVTREQRGIGAIPPAKSDRQKAEILRAAAVLFAEKGYGGTTMQQIAEAVNLTRTAFYYYFKNKEELLISLVDEVTFTLQRRTAGFLEKHGLSPSQILRDMVRNYSSLLMELAVEFRFVSRTEADFPLALAKAHDRAKRQVLDSFTEVINRGTRSGEFTVDDPRIVSLAIIGMCNWSAWWFRESGKLSREEVADRFGELALQMVGNRAISELSATEMHHEIQILRQSVSKLDSLLSKPRKKTRRLPTK